MIDVQGVSAPGPSKNIELALVDSDEQHNCGKDGKTCLSWLQLDLVTKSLRLRVEPGYILDRDVSRQQYILIKVPSAWRLTSLIIVVM